MRRIFPFLIAGVLAGVPAAVLLAQDSTEELVPEFTEAFLSDPTAIGLGQEIWRTHCTLCHGAKAYPGKAPKLKPSRYAADFVFDRVTNGFRKMPAWKDIYTFEERMGVAAYVLSRDFSP